MNERDGEPRPFDPAPSSSVPTKGGDPERDHAPVVPHALPHLETISMISPMASRERREWTSDRPRRRGPPPNKASASISHAAAMKVSAGENAGIWNAGS